MNKTTLEEAEKEIIRLKRWLAIIEETGDPHSVSCARHALDNDPAPERIRTKTTF